MYPGLHILTFHFCQSFGRFSACIFVSHQPWKWDLSFSTSTSRGIHFIWENGCVKSSDFTLYVRVNKTWNVVTCAQIPSIIGCKEVVFMHGPRLKYITQSQITVFPQGNMTKASLSLFHYTVWKIYGLIFNDCLLMFNEEIQSALCKFHPLFHYRNLSYVNEGSKGKAAVWILIVRLACSTPCVSLSLCFSLYNHPSSLC